MAVGQTNPFKGVSVGWSAKSKSVLYSEQIKALWEYQPILYKGQKVSLEQRGKDFFFFCYLCNGVNFKDVGYFKNKDIVGDVLSFTRQKTKSTKKNSREIRIYIHDEAKRIIEKYRDSKKCGADDYLFSFFNG